MILLIDNYDSFTYNLYHQIAQHADVVIFRNDELNLSDIASMNPTAIVLSPGPGTPRNAGICADVVKLCAPTTPILGVCLGMQVIVEVFGGRVAEGNPVHGKTSYIIHNSSGLLKKVPSPFPVGRYHSLKATRLPTSLSCNGYTSDGTPMSIQHNKYLCFGVQFHPESIMTPHGNILIDNFLSVVH
ncbi:aminodeoxychorismate/anthranilate synthase component II [Simkania negevensis]|uniref:Aminodeoxychorismate/anthranilate synthase component II n=1 Tax=Simkania negevensis TaxID=83561 RepID=A0ABS3APJ8_9BACT|nr:aminodeoxychorismate/anthranilate synthase component II [Simkania negevensis]